MSPCENLRLNIEVSTLQSFQKNQKYDQVGKAHPERDAQFRRIAEERASFEASGDPILRLWGCVYSSYGCHNCLAIPSPVHKQQRT